MKFYHVYIFSGSDRITIENVDGIEEGKPLRACVTRQGNPTSSGFELLLCHSLNEGQIAWFKAGSALNVLSNKKRR